MTKIDERRFKIRASDPAAGKQALSFLRLPNDALQKSITAEQQAWINVAELFLSMTHNRELARQCATIIHIPIRLYALRMSPTVTSFKITKVTSRIKHNWWDEPEVRDKIGWNKKRKQPSLVASLKRLQKAADSKSMLVWQKAQLETPNEVWSFIASANIGKPLSISCSRPQLEVAAMLPAAMASASGRDQTQIERNNAVTSVVFAYRAATGALPGRVKLAAFLNKVEAAYAEILPTAGFNVGKNTVSKCLDAAKTIQARTKAKAGAP